MESRPITSLFDSVILIDHLNGIDAATSFLKAHLVQGGISVITRAEVAAGYSALPPAVREFLDLFPTLPVDLATADLAASLRRQEGWKLPDALIAATALLREATLVTRNTKDFPPSRYGFVHIPYE